MASWAARPGVENLPAPQKQRRGQKAPKASKSSVVEKTQSACTLQRVARPKECFDHPLHDVAPQIPAQLSSLQWAPDGCTLVPSTGATSVRDHLVELSQGDLLVEPPQPLSSQPDEFHPQGTQHWFPTGSSEQSSSPQSPEASLHQGASAVDLQTSAGTDAVPFKSAHSKDAGASQHESVSIPQQVQVRKRARRRTTVPAAAHRDQQLPEIQAEAPAQAPNVTTGLELATGLHLRQRCKPVLVTRQSSGELAGSLVQGHRDMSDTANNLPQTAPAVQSAAALLQAARRQRNAALFAKPPATEQEPCYASTSPVKRGRGRPPRTVVRVVAAKEQSVRDLTSGAAKARRADRAMSSDINELERQTDAALAELGAVPVRGAGRHRLLTRQEENDLARKCRDYMGLQVAQRTLQGILHRPAQTHELARALRIHPMELCQRWTAGVEAKRQLVARNTGLVVKLATRAHNNIINGSYRTMALGDLVDEGIHGLLVALGKFDPDSGYKLSTYAVPWIQQMLQRAVQGQSSLLRLPHAVHEDVSKLRRMQRRLHQELGSRPTPEQVRDALKWTPNRLAVTLKASDLDYRASTAVSLEGSMLDDGEEGCGLGQQLAQEVEGNGGELVGSMGGGGLSVSQEEALLANDVQDLLSRALEEGMRGLHNVNHDLVLHMLRQRMGLNTPTPTQGTAAQPQSAYDSAHRQANGAMSLRQVAVAHGLGVAWARQLERGVLQAMRRMHHDELVTLADAYEEMGMSTPTPRTAPGASKKT